MHGIDVEDVWDDLTPQQKEILRAQGYKEKRRAENRERPTAWKDTLGKAGYRYCPNRCLAAWNGPDFCYVCDAPMSAPYGEPDESPKAPPHP